MSINNFAMTRDAKALQQKKNDKHLIGVEQDTTVTDSIQNTRAMTAAHR